MSVLRLLSLAAVLVLACVGQGWAQFASMGPALVEDLRDVEVQRQLIALGVLDATAGRASHPDLSKAVAWFRRAYKSAESVGPLTPGERQQLKDAYAQFVTRTDLKAVPYRDTKTNTEITLRVPAAFVGSTPQKSVGERMTATGRSSGIATTRCRSDRKFICWPTSRRLRCSGIAS